MRAYICPECHEVLAIGSDGLEASDVKHLAADGTEHRGAERVELPGHDHAAGVAWHDGKGRVHLAALRAAFPLSEADAGEASGAQVAAAEGATPAAVEGVEGIEGDGPAPSPLPVEPPA